MAFQQYVVQTSIEQHQSKEIRISPNPIHDKIIIDAGSSSISRVQLFDISGKFHAEYFGNGTAIHFDRESINSGIYLMLIFVGDDVIREKLIFD